MLEKVDEDKGTRIGLNAKAIKKKQKEKWESQFCKGFLSATSVKPVPILCKAEKNSSIHNLWQ